MRSRFTFPALNFSQPLEPQIVIRAEWVGYKLSRADSSEHAPRWRLYRRIGNDTQSFTLDSLCEVELKLAQLLEQIGERVQREQIQHMAAERSVRAQAASLIEANRSHSEPETEKA